MLDRSQPDFLLSLETPPAELPVTLEAAKENSRFDDEEDDRQFERLIKAATVYVEEQTGKSLITQTWNMKLYGVAGAQCLHLPRFPARSIEAIAYFDKDNAAQTDQVDDYFLFGDEDNAWIEPERGKTWPVTYVRPDALTVTFKTGFGDTGADVPDNLVQAILLIVGHWYENREAVVVGTIAADVPMSAQALIDLSRKGWFAG